MNVTTTAAPARTDLHRGPDARPSTSVSATTVRNHGLALAAGAGLWSAVSFVFGFNSETELGIKAQDIGGLAFQLGVFGLVGLQLKTLATGTSRKAAGMLKVERVLLALAMTWTVIHAFFPSQREELWLMILDVFWPLSMLGMFVIGVKVAFAGRWRGAARVWPLVAESWAVVSIPAMGIFGPSVGDVVGASHLLIGYVALGLILAARPHLVLSRP